MAGMTWLHLSDWHQKGKDFDRDVVGDALIEDIRNRAQIHTNLEKIDFLVFSGDVAFSGQRDEYKKARKHLFDPLLKITELNPDRLFFVPGNHDLDKEEFNYLPDEIRRSFTIETQVHTWLIDYKNRNHMLKPFAAYTDFVREFTGLEQPAYANIRSYVVDDGIRIGLLGLNSALMCGRNKDDNGEVNDHNHLIVGEPQLFEPLKQLARAQVRIAVLHHPFEWLVEFDRNRVENRLRRECHFILCGHQHKPNISVERGMIGDCVIIPAGASYDTRVAWNPLYTNSYNFVHLDFATAQGTIYLRRWSEKRDEWIEDIDSHKGGMVQFSLPESLKNLRSSPPATPIISTSTRHIKTEHELAMKPHNEDITPNAESQAPQPQSFANHNVKGEQIFSSETGSSSQNGQTTSEPSIANNDYTLKSSSEKFLEKARGYITEAKECVQNATTPFEGQGYIWERAYIEASKLFEKTMTHLQAMHEFLDKVVSLPEAPVEYPKLVANYNDIVNQIYEIESELDTLISYIEDEQPQREYITKNASSLVQQMNALNQSIQEEDISHSGT